MQTSSTPSTDDPLWVQRWERRADNGEWQLLEEDFDSTGLEAIGDGLWIFPSQAPEEHARFARSLFGNVFRVAVGLQFENPESRPNTRPYEGWGERVLDDVVPGTEIYIDDQGKYVFRHIGANHFLLDNSARYPDGSVGKETTLTVPDKRVFHARGLTEYPDGRSLNRRTGILTDLGGNAQQLERRPDGEWEVPTLL